MFSVSFQDVTHDSAVSPRVNPRTRVLSMVCRLRRNVRLQSSSCFHAIRPFYFFHYHHFHIFLIVCIHGNILLAFRFSKNTLMNSFEFLVLSHLRFPKSIPDGCSKNGLGCQVPAVQCPGVSIAKRFCVEWDPMRSRPLYVPWSSLQLQGKNDRKSRFVKFLRIFL